MKPINQMSLTEIADLLGGISFLIREHGLEKTALILAERKRLASNPEPTPGDSCELTPEEWQRQIEANRRKQS